MFYFGNGNEERCNAGPSQKTFTLPQGYFSDARNASQSMATSCAGDGSSVNATTQKSCPSHAAAEAGIGIGVGLPLAIALGTALFLLFREKKRRGQENFTLQKHSEQAILLKTVGETNAPRLYRSTATMRPGTLFEQCACIPRSRLETSPYDS